MTATGGLLAASLLHLGFQATVTAVVYPALVDLPLEGWDVAHAAHSRRIGPVVAVVYGALVVSGALLVVSGGSSPAEWVAVGAAGVAIVVTATVAGPAHLRLSPDRSADLVARLIAADRVRLVAAAIGAGAALVAAS